METAVRADYLKKIAAEMRRRKWDLSATMVWEKQAAAAPANPADRPPASPVIPPPGVH